MGQVSSRDTSHTIKITVTSASCMTKLGRKLLVSKTEHALDMGHVGKKLGAWVQSPVQIQSKTQQKHAYQSIGQTCL